jgi:pimeloyl-ACP methyl ester carboxylesterase
MALHHLIDAAMTDGAHVRGLHFNDCSVPPPPGNPPETGVPPADLQRMRAREAELKFERAYLELNSKKPDFAGYELVDSPIGLAAWIVDKYRAWSDGDRNPEKKFTKDELLTNIMVYWVTETGASAGRIYRESRRDAKVSFKVGTPTAYAVFPKNETLLPRRWIEARYNVTRWTEMPRGGHFAALEEPELFVGDVRAFFRSFR